MAYKCSQCWNRKGRSRDAPCRGCIAAEALASANHQYMQQAIPLDSITIPDKNGKEPQEKGKMQYRVRRTSISPFDNDPPCKEAYRIKVPYWDVRCCTEEHFDKVIAKRYPAYGEWRSRGKYHCRVTPGNKKCDNGSHIARRMNDVDVWVIDINSLEKLMKFIKKYGACIISIEIDGAIDEPYPTIEIYDGYRE